jgi:hypothetical protein
MSFNIVFKVHGLFISLSTFNWRHSPKSLSSAETDLVESTTVQQLWALGDNKKADFRHFLNSSKLSTKSVQVISPYTSNASDSHTVLHTLCFNQWKCAKLYPHIVNLSAIQQ